MMARGVATVLSNLSGCSQLPEPHALEDPDNHPLWATICHSCLELPSHVQDAYVLSGIQVDCRHSCMIVVSTTGRLLYQRRRQGSQLFGGGKHSMPLVWRCHSIRREQWMESNLDVGSNRAVIWLSNPILAIQAAFYGGCLVQICIIADHEIISMDDLSLIHI